MDKKYKERECNDVDQISIKETTDLHTITKDILLGKGGFEFQCDWHENNAEISIFPLVKELVWLTPIHKFSISNISLDDTICLMNTIRSKIDVYKSIIDTSNDGVNYARRIIRFKELDIPEMIIVEKYFIVQFTKCIDKEETIFLFHKEEYIPSHLGGGTYNCLYKMKM